jgi:hypothetical protein
MEVLQLFSHGGPFRYILYYSFFHMVDLSGTFCTMYYSQHVCQTQMARGLTAEEFAVLSFFVTFVLTFPASNNNYSVFGSQPSSKGTCNNLCRECITHRKITIHHHFTHFVLLWSYSTLQSAAYAKTVPTIAPKESLPCVASYLFFVPKQWDLFLRNYLLWPSQEHDEGCRFGCLELSGLQALDL